MDFSYQYSPEQEEFRAAVSRWLEENTPSNAAALFDSSAGSDALSELSRIVGGRGWLAPAVAPDEGGAGLSADLTVVVLEELNQRGLLSLVQSEAQALRTALNGWKSEYWRASLASELAGGKRAVWRHEVSVLPRVDGSLVLNRDSVGLTAEPDADGYLVNGTASFKGMSATPDILWTVALVESESADPLPVCLIVDASTDGIELSATGTVSAYATRIVRFHDVWVLRTDALGPEGEGHRVVTTQVSLEPNADLPGWVEVETDALMDYARHTKSGGQPLGADPIRASILVEAYIASRVSRLLRMRATWVQSQGGQTVVSDALGSLWRRAAAAGLSDTARQVAGPRALLSSDDPQSADGGRFERLSRRELAERESGSMGDVDREALASALGLDSNISCS